MPESAGLSSSRSNRRSVHHLRRSAAVNRDRISEVAFRWGYSATARLLSSFGLKETVRNHLLPRLMGVLHSSDREGSSTDVERHIENEIKRIVEKPGPILVGPWLSEVGSELLYWIPMLRWIKERFGLDPADRVVVVSRGAHRAGMRDSRRAISRRLRFVSLIATEQRARSDGKLRVQSEAGRAPGF